MYRIEANVKISGLYLILDTKIFQIMNVKIK